MRITIPEIPPSLNRFAGRKNVHEYRREKNRWKYMVALLSKQVKPDKPIDQAIVRIAYHFPDAIRRDPDNYAGKMILDGLTAAGIIVDDSFTHIRLELSGQIDRANPRTEIEVQEVKVNGKE